MSRTEVSIPMPEGSARAFVFTPDQGEGPWPTAVIFMDAPAIRPSLFEMGERLASHGYYVLLPDMFWRLGPYEPIDLQAVFRDEAVRREVFGKMTGSTNPQKAVADMAVWFDWLEKQPKAKADKIGVTGYCMGGGLALRAAGNFPDRVVAAGAFHPGNVATDAPDSPHLLAPKTKAKVLVGGADQDAGFDEAQKDRLDKAFRDAGVEAEVGIWAGAKHGYVPTDMPVYNKDAAERHWRELIALFDSKLK
ncbi:dienelactone hydrolase family protein [Phenylobacterium sp.]|uniref:dienelactone hydrolase family protein n=1 Tax=Phenylobacterium sp. TaxID=1871053 RepID=UPI0027366B72|nr:dienelactone hydrolase family protein [Phenylobacterium sp.]MDP3659175.1 dienelactone hydrolase family protein [Phenylobacterium sp.]